MPTSSITKKFIIRDEETCKRLIEILNQPSHRKKKTSSNKFEEGKKLLANLSYH